MYVGLDLPMDLGGIVPAFFQLWTNRKILQMVFFYELNVTRFLIRSLAILCFIG